MSTAQTPVCVVSENGLGVFMVELRIGGIFLPRNRPTLGPQVQSQSPELLD